MFSLPLFSCPISSLSSRNNCPLIHLHLSFWALAPLQKSRNLWVSITFMNEAPGCCIELGWTSFVSVIYACVLFSQLHWRTQKVNSVYMEKGQLSCKWQGQALNCVFRENCKKSHADISLGNALGRYSWKEVNMASMSRNRSWLTMLWPILPAAIELGWPFKVVPNWGTHSWYSKF